MKWQSRPAKMQSNPQTPGRSPRMCSTTYDAGPCHTKRPELSRFSASWYDPRLTIHHPTERANPCQTDDWPTPGHFVRFARKSMLTVTTFCQAINVVDRRSKVNASSKAFLILALVISNIAAASQQAKLEFLPLHLHRLRLPKLVGWGKRHLPLPLHLLHRRRLL